MFYTYVSGKTPSYISSTSAENNGVLRLTLKLTFKNDFASCQALVFCLAFFLMGAPSFDGLTLAFPYLFAAGL